MSAKEKRQNENVLRNKDNQMRFLLLSFYTSGYQSVADMTIPNRDLYCKQFDYHHIVKIGPFANAGEYYAIDRVRYLYHLLFDDQSKLRDGDAIWVLNIQSIITNLSIPLDRFVDIDHDFWIHRDCNAVNAGSFIIRKSEWARQWLQLIIDEAPRVNHCWHENKVIIDRCVESPWKERIRILDHPGINSYLYSEAYNMHGRSSEEGQWHPGDFACSLPGMSLEKRLVFIPQLLSQVQQSIIT